MYMILRGALIVTLCIAAILATDTDEPRPASADESDSTIVPGRYIVALRAGVDATAASDELATRYGLTVHHVYDEVLNGFAATIPDNQVSAVAAEPAVLQLIEDQLVSLLVDATPTGIHRTEANRNGLTRIGSGLNPIDVDVAVIDTGIDLDHVDLNVAGGVNCVPGQTSFDDAHGHGTHVAGTIGALDNGAGVVGVAPGARLWAVRVLNENGSGATSDLICGLDWVTAHADVIEVANMSLGVIGLPGNCTDGGMRQAVCTSVAAGVTYIAAAGNSSLDANWFTPASYPEVITVSALADTDGLPGGQGPPSPYGPDDTLASFSNYGSVVDLAAPGVSILSTWNDGGYNTISGTSMAGPHVAGAAAVYLYQNPGASPAAVQQYLRSIAWEQGSAYGFSGDPDGYPEPLLNAGAIGGLPLLPAPPPPALPPPPPPPEPACDVDTTTGTVGSSIALTCVDFAASEWVHVYWDSTDSTAIALALSTSTGAVSAAVKVPNGPGGAHTLIVRGDTSGIVIEQGIAVTPSVSLSLASGEVNDYVSATLRGFAANESVELAWAGASLAAGTTATTGDVRLNFRIPAAPAGSYPVVATGATSGSTSPVIVAVLPELRLTGATGTVGSSVTATLTGMAANDGVTLTWAAGAGGTLELATLTTSALGQATTTFVVPSDTNGAHVVTATGAGGVLATAGYTVRADLTASVTRGAPGDALTLAFSGFGAGEAIDIVWYDGNVTRTLAEAATSATGDGALTLNVPEAVYGSHRVEARGRSSSASDYLFFTISQSLRLEPTAGEAGTQITVELAGFRGSDPVDLKWYVNLTNMMTLTSLTTSPTGSAAASFTVPSDATPGDHQVAAQSTTSTLKGSATFTVELAGAPPAGQCSTQPDSSVVGASVAVQCTGFAGGEWVRVYWDSTSTSYKAYVRASSTGSIAFDLTIPAGAIGEHQIIAVGASSGTQSSGPFSVLPHLKLSTSSGLVGSSTFVYLSGYGASTPVEVRWTGASGSSQIVAQGTTNASGGASIYVKIPEAPGGVYGISAAGDDGTSAGPASFTVLPQVLGTPSSGKVGGSVTLKATGFQSGEAVTFTWWTDEQTAVQPASAIASAGGTATATITIPESIGGPHRIDADGSQGSAATGNITVTQSISLSTTSGVPGKTITVELRGFGAGELVELYWFDTSTSSTLLISASASPAGSATVTLTIPDAINGSHKLQATGAASGGSVSTYFFIQGALTPAQSSGAAGSTIDVTVQGFKAQQTVEIRWYATTTSYSVVATLTVSATGDGSTSFVVPAGATLGGHKVEAVGSGSSPKASATITVQ